MVGGRFRGWCFIILGREVAGEWQSRLIELFPPCLFAQFDEIIINKQRWDHRDQEEEEEEKGKGVGTWEGNTT